MVVGTIHRIVNALISIIFALGIMTTAGIALRDAPGTPYSNERWDGITISGVVLGSIQIVTNFPYMSVSKRNRNKTVGKYVDRIWGSIHVFCSAVSLTLFFLTFYLDDLQSADLRTTFWSQFKFEVDPKNNKQYLEVLVIFTDFVGFNFLLSLGVVFYPKVSRLWNRNSPDVPIHIAYPGA